MVTTLRSRARWFFLVIFGAAAAGTCVSILGLLLRADLGGSHPQPAAAALAERTQVAVAIPLGRSGDSRQVTIISPLTSESRPVGAPDSYSSLAWSPDGELIAAVASDGQQSRLHLIGATGRESIVNIASDVVFPSWSSDGTHIALVGQHVYLVDRSGSVEVDVAAPALEGVSGEAHYSSGYAWSPDGRLFSTAVNGLLVVIATDGTARSAPISALLEGVDTQKSAILGWKDRGTLVVAVPAGAYALDASGPELTASAIPGGQELPIPESARPPDRPVVEEVERLAPGMTIFRAQPSADGSADVFELRSASDAASGPRLLIRGRITGTLFEAKDLPVDLRGGSLYDVFVAASSE